MPLIIKRMILEDFDKLEKLRFNHGGDLIAPAVPAIWHDSPDDAAMTLRNKWSMKQQREMFQDDPSATFLLVVDTDNNDEPLSLARWHYYEKGFQPEFTTWELNGRAPDAESTWPELINVAFLKDFLTVLLDARPTWMESAPQWVLTTLMTRASARKRGAGGMLVDWGVKQAIKDGVPAYLEAGAAAAPFYAKLGFEVVGDIAVDLSAHGMPDKKILKKMVANLRK